LEQGLRDVPGLRPFINSCADAEPAYYKVGFQLDSSHFGLMRDRFLAALRAEGFAFDAGFPALHVGRSPRRFRQAGDLPEAGRAHLSALVLHHPVLLGTDKDIDEIVQAVKKVHAHADRLTGG
jgi:hypothetical protein